MSGAQRVTGPTRFDLGPYRVEVLMANEGWHLRVVAGPFPGGNMVTVANFMPDGATAAQLRAIAMHLDGVVA